jgi:Putative prokaryotic signal transducing protein
MDADDLTEIYATNDPALAQIIKIALAEEDIACELEGEHQAGLTGIFDIRIFVRTTDVSRARAVIDQHEHRA